MTADFGFQAKAGDRVVVLRDISIEEIFERLGPAHVACTDDRLPNNKLVEVTYK